MLRKVVQRQLTRKHGVKNVHSTNVLKIFFYYGSQNSLQSMFNLRYHTSASCLCRLSIDSKQLMAVTPEYFACKKEERFY